MKTRLLLSLLCLFLSHAHGEEAAPAAAPDGNTVYRTWTDNRGKTLEATFRGIENGQVFLQIRDGYVHRLPLERLSPADQEMARTLKPEGLGIPADPRLAQAAARIDQLVNAGLAKAQLKPNPLASDEQFVRRVYLDIAGRIPTREEALEFINDPSVSKRAKVIDKLLNSDGYRSHLFNYFADMMRVADEANKVRFYTYQDWLKNQIEVNEPWDKMVHAMMAADGKLLDNGATGYLLRDAGMSFAVTTSMTGMASQSFSGISNFLFFKLSRLSSFGRKSALQFLDLETNLRIFHKVSKVATNLLF
jgi:hypothetical protein